MATAYVLRRYRRAMAQGTDRPRIAMANALLVISSPYPEISCRSRTIRRRLPAYDDE